MKTMVRRSDIPNMPPTSIYPLPEKKYIYKIKTLNSIYGGYSNSRNAMASDRASNSERTYAPMVIAGSR